MVVAGCRLSLAAPPPLRLLNCLLLLLLDGDGYVLVEYLYVQEGHCSKQGQQQGRQ